MFSGIIETTQKIVDFTPQEHVVKIQVEKPDSFNDIKLGDSIAVNGICLTVESIDFSKIGFVLGKETLQVLGEHGLGFQALPVNLERSLNFGSRVHGHIVSGHVDTLVQIIRSEPLGENWQLTVQVPSSLAAYVWLKGSVALNGVSLTVNRMRKADGKNQDAVLPGQLPDTRYIEVEVGLIPETQRRTNLTQFKVGQWICFEADSFAKAIFNAVTHYSELKSGLGGDRNV